jgi:DNA (cytosine-5)-methyltransferase 1
VERPSFEAGGDPFRLVDLFCGCGGLTLGVAQAVEDHGLSLEVPLALDLDADALAVYATNFPKAVVREDLVEHFVDGDLGAPITEVEKATQALAGTVDAVVAGPPCQGHSDLNNHTRRNDPKNALYLRAARAVEVLRPRMALIENVPAVQHDRSAVVLRGSSAMEAAGYTVAHDVLRLDQLGVPQRRKRHVHLAVRDDQSVSARHLLGEMVAIIADPHDVAWAIEDLRHISERDGVDLIPRSSPDNLFRMNWLLEHDEYNLPNQMRPLCHRGDHTYTSMYGRLKWSQPAQTITSGFSSIGQGRFMHPAEPRALTVHEAARLQGFPDYFDFSSVWRRTALTTMVGNAVPPALARAVFRLFLEGGGG